MRNWLPMVSGYREEFGVCRRSLTPKPKSRLALSLFPGVKVSPQPIHAKSYENNMRTRSAAKSGSKQSTHSHRLNCLRGLTVRPLTISGALVVVPSRGDFSMCRVGASTPIMGLIYHEYMPPGFTTS